jgi:hypothetical protein
MLFSFHDLTIMWDFTTVWPLKKADSYSCLSGDQIPVGVRFFAHVQTGPEAHPESCTMGTEFFPGVKLLGRGADNPLPSSAEVTKG